MFRKPGLFLLLFIVTSCAAPWRDVSKVEPGMTYEQVIDFAGEPIKKTKTASFEDWMYHLASSPLDTDGSDTSSYIFRFRNGKLNSFGPLRGRYPISIQNYGNLSESNKSIYILPGNVGVEESDLKFRTLSKQLRRYLQKRGYQMAENATQADELIFFSYAVSDPRREFKIETQPVFKWVAPQAKTYHVSNSLGQNVGTISEAPRIGSYQQVGQRTTSHTTVKYKTTVALQTYKNKRTNKPIPIWESRIVAENESSDLRNNVFELLSYSADSIGIDNSRALRRVGFDFNPYF